MNPVYVKKKKKSLCKSCNVQCYFVHQCPPPPPPPQNVAILTKKSDIDVFSNIISARYVQLAWSLY